MTSLTSGREQGVAFLAKLVELTAKESSQAKPEAELKEPTALVTNKEVGQLPRHNTKASAEQKEERRLKKAGGMGGPGMGMGGMGGMGGMVSFPCPYRGTTCGCPVPLEL